MLTDTSLTLKKFISNGEKIVIGWILIVKFYDLNYFIKT